MANKRAVKQVLTPKEQCEASRQEAWEYYLKHKEPDDYPYNLLDGQMVREYKDTCN